MSWLLLFAALASSARSAMYADMLLDGVTSVPLEGVPGCLVACGATTEGVLTGETADRLLMAAATYGNGKVIAFSHDSYIKRFKEWAKLEKISLSWPVRFFENIQGWLTDSAAVKNVNLNASEVVPIFESTRVSSVNWTAAKTVIWTGSNFDDPDMENKLRAWIKSGGGFVTGHTFWALKYPNSMDRLLRSFGMSIRRGHEYIRGPNPLAVAKSKHAYASVSSMIKTVSPNMTEEEYVGLAGIYYCELTDEHLRATQTAYLLNFDKIAFTPSAYNTVTAPPAKAMVRLAAFISENGAFARATPPGIEHLPGTFAQDPPLSEVTVEVRASCEHKYTPIGYYAKPAKPFRVEKLSVTDDKKVWQIKVGSQTSNFNDYKGRYKRYPNLHQTFDVSAASNEFTTAYGGSIYVYSPKGSRNETIRLKLSNVVQSPFLDTQDNTTVTEWDTRKNAPGLWADLCGEFVCFSIPSAVARKVPEPAKLLKDWDDIAWSMHYLRGEGWNVRDRKADWFTFDVDGWGWMWAMYPIGGKREFSMTKGDVLRLSDFAIVFPKGTKKGTGSWGPIHELGHRAQKDDWTFKYFNEVTVNIFTLHAYYYKFNVPQWEHPKLYPSKLQYRLKWLNNDTRKFARPVNYNAVIGLAIYQQLQHEFGWGSFMKIFREYETLSIPDDKEIDEWIIRFSKTVNLNLIPLFELWKYPISETVNNTLAGYRPFYPDDRFTQGCPNCTAELLAKYPNAVRSGSPLNVSYPDVIPPPVVPTPYVKVLSHASLT